jgi:hypothetical protein
MTSLGYNVDVSTFVDSGILDLRNKTIQNSYQPLVETYSHKEIILETNTARKKEIKKQNISQGDISEFSERIKEAKMRHLNISKTSKPDKVLSRAFNSIAVI